MADGIFEKVYNPDVLSCLANLSNDEVFTPPAVANQMLDMLPQELFSNPDAKFLDPATKSGVFLREIAKRLIKGLEHQKRALSSDTRPQRAVGAYFQTSALRHSYNRAYKYDFTPQPLLQRISEQRIFGGKVRQCRGKYSV